jgi:hypothetical protein
MAKKVKWTYGGGGNRMNRRFYIMKPLKKSSLDVIASEAKQSHGIATAPSGPRNDFFRGFLISISAMLLALLPLSAHARGHDGFFIGGGYEQLVMYTPEYRLSGAAQPPTNERVSFGPGFGAHLLVGYDFKNSRWGVQMPFDYSYFKLNHEEWVHFFQIGAEGILHLASWDNGIDVSLVGGAGASLLPEGPLKNNTGAKGMYVGAGPAFNYFFARGATKGSLYVQIPIRAVIFFGDNLSKSHTTALSIPIRLGISVGF